MTRENLLKSSQEIASNIFDKMGVIESCESMTRELEEMEIGCIKQGEAISLAKVLTTEQLKDIKGKVKETIDGNAKEAEAWLTGLTSIANKAPETTPEKAPAKKTVKKAPAKKTTTKAAAKKADSEKTEIDIDEAKLAELYVRDGKTVKDIADEFETDKETIHAKITELGLKKPAGMDVAEEAGWKKRVMSRFMKQE